MAANTQTRATLRRVELFEIAGVWPHVLQVEGGWEGILRSHANDEIIKWHCGHTHLKQRDAKACANWRFERRLDAKGIS